MVGVQQVERERCERWCREKYCMDNGRFCSRGYWVCLATRCGDTASAVMLATGMV